MTAYRFIIKKIAIILASSAVLCLLVSTFSKGGRLYAGFTAGFLGAAFILASWSNLLRANGRRMFPFLRRQSSPAVPFFHQNEKKLRLGFFSGKSFFADSLEDETEEYLNEMLPFPVRLKALAVSYAICGAVMFAASFFIGRIGR